MFVTLQRQGYDCDIAMKRVCLEHSNDKAMFDT
jgi:hypothetical protein